MVDQWFDDYAEDEDELQVDEYDITATPNDFNVSTLFNSSNLELSEFLVFNAISFGIKFEPVWR